MFLGVFRLWPAAGKKFLGINLANLANLARKNMKKEQFLAIFFYFPYEKEAFLTYITEGYIYIIYGIKI